MQLSPSNYDVDQKYWNQTEPIWITADKNVRKYTTNNNRCKMCLKWKFHLYQKGLKTASSFWLGADVWYRESDLFLAYDQTFKFEERVKDIVSWYKKFDIDLGTLFFNEPYQTGNISGPESVEYENKIKEIDQLVGYLLQRLENEDLLDKINIIIVSGSGMATVKNTILLSSLTNETNINLPTTAYDVVSNIYPKSDSVVCFFILFIYLFFHSLTLKLNF